MEAITDVGDWIHEKRKAFIEYQQDFYEWLGFFIHRNQNAVLMACFAFMWVLSTCSMFANTMRDHRDKIRMGTGVPHGYAHWMALKPYLGDNLGTPVNNGIFFTAGSNAKEGNIMTADRIRDIMAYNDMMARGIHICRHKNNGKVKVKCDHPMARKFSYKNDCFKHQPNYQPEEFMDGDLYYLDYDESAHKNIRKKIKENYPALYTEYYSGVAENAVPEIWRDTLWQWTSFNNPTGKIANIAGTLDQCLSEQNPLRMRRFTSEENRYHCKCSTFQYGKPMNISYNGYPGACHRCWNTELQEPMPLNFFNLPLTGWGKVSAAGESYGFGMSDGRIYEMPTRFALRTGIWKDHHVRRWFRRLYDDPNYDMNGLVLGVNNEQLKLECGTRTDARKQCVAWKQSTGQKYAIGPLGDTRCKPLKEYEQCIERNIRAEGIIMMYQFGLPKWGQGDVNPYKNQYMKGFEKEVIQYIVGKASGHAMAALSHVKPYFINHCAYGRELGRILVMAVPWYLGGGFIVACSSMLFMGRIDWIDGRWLLGMFTVFSGTACLFGAFGIAAITGGTAPIAAILFLYLIIIAVAVDDMIIIVDEFEKIVPPKDQVQTVDDRIAWKISQALRECGPSITLTTTTTCIAFLIGAITSKMCIMRQFDVLMIGFYAFALDFLYQLFFFVPLLLKDEKRRLKSRWGCAPCCCEWPDSAPGSDEDRLTVNRGYLTVFCEKYLLQIVMNKWMRAGMITTILITWCLSLATLPTLAKMTDVAPPFSDAWAANSYARETTTALLRAQKAGMLDMKFKGGWFWLKDFNAADPVKRKHLRMFLDHMHYHYRVAFQQDYEWAPGTGMMSTRKGTEYTPWTKPIPHNILEKFHNDRVCACDAEDNKCPHPFTGEMIQYGRCESRGAADEQSWGPGFTYKDPDDDGHWPPHFVKYYRPTYREQLNLLLATPSAGMKEQDYVWQSSNDGSRLTYAVRFKALYPYRDALTVTKFYKETQDIMESYQLGKFWKRDLCYSSNFKDCGTYMTIDTYDLSERSLLVVQWMWELILIFDFTMLVCLVFWLPFCISFFACFMVFILQCHMFGIIYTFGIELNMIVLIALTVTCGICIDEITHAMYALVYSYGTVEERLHETIVGHGPSIIKGAISTMIGVTMLSGSSSPFWQTFFYIIFFLCLFGSIMGIVVVPSIIVSFLHDSPHPDDLCFADDFDDDKHQVEMGNIGEDGLSVVQNDDSRVASSFKSKADSSASGLDSRVD